MTIISFHVAVAVLTPIKYTSLTIVGECCFQIFIVRTKTKFLYVTIPFTSYQQSELRPLKAQGMNGQAVEV